MFNGYNTADGLAIDSQSLDALRTQAKQAPDKALEKAAKQFEAVFMNMLMKSMRDATPQDGMFDSEQTKMFSSMLDQQLAQSVGGSHGIGLADMMVKQLSRHAPAGATPAIAAALPPAPALARHVRSKRRPYHRPIMKMRSRILCSACCRMPRW